MAEESTGFDLYIDGLKHEPTPGQVVEYLTELKRVTKSAADELRLVSVLLDTTIPQIYGPGSATIKNLITDSLRSLKGVGGLLNKIRSVLDTRDDQQGRVLVRYIEVLTAVFNGTLVANLNSANPLEVNEVNKLLFRGLAFSIVSEARLKGHGHDGDGKLGVFGGVDRFVSYLTFQLVCCDDIPADAFNKYVASLMSFNEEAYKFFLDGVFTKEYWPKFVGFYKTMKQFQQKNMITYFLKYLDRKNMLQEDDGQNLDAIFNLILPLVTDSLVDMSLVDTGLSFQCRAMNSLLAHLIHLKAKNQMHWCQLLLNKWGNGSLIGGEPVVLQEYRTHFLIHLVRLQTAECVTQLISDPLFVDGVSNRLNSYSNPVKTLAIIAADSFCVLAKREKIFLVENLDGYEYLLSDSSYRTSLKPFDWESSWVKVSESLPPVEAEISSDRTLHKDRGLDSAMSTLRLDSSDPIGNDSDSGDSDDDDDPTIVQRAKVPKPIYIKELIKYLRVDSKNSQAYDMMKLALTTGPTLIRQKAEFGAELRSNSYELIQTLISLADEFSIGAFDDLRLNNIVAVLVSDPRCGIEIVQMLGTGDYSLQQRVIILSSLSLAARDIRGFKDHAVTKSYEERNFPTNQLPSKLHEQYLNLDPVYQKSPNQGYLPGRVRNANLSIQDALMHDDSESAKDELLGGKILRISRKLLKKPDFNSITPRSKNYSTIISKNFYFPLVYLWHESGGIHIGHYSTLLIGHYIQTMALLLHCSISAVSNNDMIREFLIIVGDLIKSVTPEQLQVIEGIVTGLLIICDVSDEQQLLINFGNYLMSIQQWLNDMWEAIIDNRIKSLSAGFLLRLTRILDKYQATMIDQMNNMYY